MTGGNLDARLAVLRDNLAKLAMIPQGSLEEFQSDFRNVDSALHRLQTSIQALIDVGSYVVSQLGLAPPRTSLDILTSLETAEALPAGTSDRYGAIFGFRNRIVHLYDRVDDAIVFRILTEERHELATLLDLLLAPLDG